MRMAATAFSNSTWLKSISALSLIALLVYTLLHLSDADTQDQVLKWRPPIAANPFAEPDFQCDGFDAGSFRSLAATHRMSQNVTYFRRHVRTYKELVSPPPTEKLQYPLLSIQGATLVNSTTAEISTPLRCSPALWVPITNSKPSGTADLSIFLFGVSTTLDRLYASIPHFVRYLTKPGSTADGSRISNNAGLVLLLHNSTNSEIQEAQTRLSDAGIAATVRLADPTHSTAEHYFGLVPALYEHAMLDKTFKRKWLVLIDDDTFYPHPQQMLETFKKLKNATTVPYFLGGIEDSTSSLEEDDDSRALNSGAGIFLSLPMAAELLAPSEKDKPDSTIWHQCLAEDLATDRGDSRISHCISNHTGTRSTHLTGLHHEDIVGDPSGFYESGKQMLSMHHRKSWHWLKPSAMSLAGDICGEDCVLQRWVFPSNEGQGVSEFILPPIILTNGYSLVEYPEGIHFDWSDTENTFDRRQDSDSADVDSGLGSLRPKLSKREKRTWSFLDSIGGAGVGVRQWYGWRNERDEIESVAELVWLP